MGSSSIRTTCLFALALAVVACADEPSARRRSQAEAVCGDGEVQAGEACDDGNREDGDGCSADCSSEERCGNGRLDPGERCDDGNQEGGDGCSADCRSTEICGNGIVDVNEECDPGAATDSADCDADCTAVVCGDGHANAAAGEVCDDGGESATCTSICTSTTCGDGVVNPAAGEECDDAGESATCDLDCTLAACGDAVVNFTAGEACDDGNLDDADGCLATCVFNVCGDGVLNEDAEDCDDGNTVTETECPYGTPTCVACDATCEEELELVGAYCGDGIVSHGEACDSRSGGTCGACSATCEELTLARARGTIAAPAGSEIDDGDSITLSDGLRPPLVLELDDDGVVSPGAVRVAFSRAWSAVAVARAIGNAISASALSLWANVSGAVVTVEHLIPGSMGNQPIEASGPFSVSGLEGGLGNDCPAGTPCAQDADCDPRLVCGTDGFCEAP